MSIGQRIKERRLKLGMTQKQLGELCGVADSAIRKYESGKIIPKRSTIMKITYALSMSELELYEKEDMERDARIKDLNESLSKVLVGEPADKAAFVRAVSDLPEEVFSTMLQKWIAEANEVKKKLDTENK